MESYVSLTSLVIASSALIRFLFVCLSWGANILATAKRICSKVLGIFVVFTKIH